MPIVKKVRKQSKRKVVRKKIARKSVIDRISPIHFDKNDGISINLYGKSATGKTTLWATFPKPILSIICSGLKKPGELLSINTPEYRKTIKTVTLENSDEMLELVEHQQKTSEYKTVVLDHATGLQDLLLKEILGLEQLPAQGSWGMADQRDWQQCSLKTKEFLRELLNLDCNRIIIAQEKIFDNDSDDDLISPSIASALTPSITGWLGPACNYVCNTFIKQKTMIKKVKIGKKVVHKEVKTSGVDYCLRTAPNSVYAIKFRVPKGQFLPEHLVDPSYTKIKKLIDGK